VFSVGVLYAIQGFLEYVDTRQMAVSDFYKSFPRFNNVSSSDIVSTAQAHGWILVDETGDIRITDSGRTIIKAGEPKLRLRRQLQALVLLGAGSWAGLLVRGRSEFARYSTPNVVQCFRDADLLDSVDTDVVEWWDNIAGPIRGRRESYLLEIGRKGERLSVEYEYSRVGQLPNWVALDNNSAGYDLLSVVEPLSNTKLVIEVKTSELPWARAEFFLSRNEWDILSAHSHATIHLWSIASTQPKFQALPISVLEQHIPTDRGAGKWNNVRIPFTIIDSKQ
jgi:hypothetical protein